MALTKKQRNGLLYAFIGVFAFSLSLPFTKLALKSFDPLFTAFARPLIACTLAIPLMIYRKVPKLPRSLWRAARASGAAGRSRPRDRRRSGCTRVATARRTTERTSAAAGYLRSAGASRDSRGGDRARAGRGGRGRRSARRRGP